jgi:hypothetical protein
LSRAPKNIGVAHPWSRVRSVDGGSGMARGSRIGKREIAWFVRLLVTFGPAIWLVSLNAPVAAPITWALLGFFLLILPRSCRATKTDGTLCANNSNGLLGGYHVRKHKWQNAWRLIPLHWRPASARPDMVLVRRRSTAPIGSALPPPPRADPGLWGTPAAAVTTIVAIVTTLSFVVSILAWQFPIK